MLTSQPPQVLQREPGCAKLMPTDILHRCLQSRSSLELAALLVQNCSTHCLTFELWCLDQTDLAHIIAQNSSFLSLLSSYLQHVTTEDPCRPKDSKCYQLLSHALTEQMFTFLNSLIDVWIFRKYIIIKVRSLFFLKIFLCKTLSIHKSSVNKP